jgi:hypothetical protein
MSQGTQTLLGILVSVVLILWYGVTNNFDLSLWVFSFGVYLVFGVADGWNLSKWLLGYGKSKVRS